jgi:hypothetical protein
MKNATANDLLLFLLKLRMDGRIDLKEMPLTVTDQLFTGLKVIEFSHAHVFDDEDNCTNELDFQIEYPILD